MDSVFGHWAGFGVQSSVERCSGRAAGSPCRVSVWCLENVESQHTVIGKAAKLSKERIQKLKLSETMEETLEQC